jgi:hypothetical protein
MDEYFVETQWTPQARAAYGQRLEELHAALDAHAAVVLDRSGRESEMKGYFASADRLARAAAAFADSEFDLCGSSALNVDVEEDAFEDDDADEVWGSEAVATGEVLSILGRWDYRVIDEAATIAAGRDAYLRAWQDATEEDASIRVQDVEHAVGELMHTDGLAVLGDTPGLQLERDTVFVLTHEGDGDEAYDVDPFGIVRD